MIIIQTRSVRETVLLLILFVLYAAPADSADRRFERLAPQIEQLRAASNIPSVAIGVGQGGRIVWETGFGWADRENRIPATEHTIYALASISKPLTATGLMALVQAGRIDLDAPINEYLGDAKLVARVRDSRGATVREVANHTSGLPIHSQFFFADELYTTPSADQTILRYGNLVTVPGERFQYSNLGYGVLGEIIERVSGQPYAQYMRQHVFQRLGMTHTSVGCTAELKAYCAVLYDKTGTRIPHFSADTPAAGDVVGSAHDLVRFGMFHLGNRLTDQSAILSDTALDAMHRATAQDGTRGYGIGWEEFRPTDGYRVLSHRGGMPGVATLLQLVPDEGLAVVVLANGQGEEGLYRSQVWAIGNLIMKTMLPRWSPPTRSSSEAAVPTAPTSPLRGEWRGHVHTHRGDLPLVLTFLGSGEVHVRFGDQLPGLLSDVSFTDGWLRGRTTGNLDTEEVDRHPHKYLELILKLRGDVLNGSVVATTDEPRGFELAHWAELKRQQQ